MQLLIFPLLAILFALSDSNFNFYTRTRFFRKWGNWFNPIQRNYLRHNWENRPGLWAMVLHFLFNYPLAFITDLWHLLRSVTIQSIAMLIIASRPLYFAWYWELLALNVIWGVLFEMVRFICVDDNLPV